MRKNKQRLLLDVTDVGDYQVLTDHGFIDINKVMITERYQPWYIETKTCSLVCADDHLVFDSDFCSIHIQELEVGDVIQTEHGPEIVIIVREVVSPKINMVDLEIADGNHRFYTNGILSHNSIVLGNIAVRAAKNKMNVAVVTVELGDSKYVKRLGSNMYDVPKDMYENLKKDDLMLVLEQAISKKEAELGGIGYLHVKEYPTSGVNVYEIETYLQGIERTENIKFEVVVIDYLNLLASSRTKSDENLYVKIKTLAEELRKIAQRNSWTIVSATQVKLAYYNTDEMGLGSSAESSGLVATVDALFSIYSPLSMDQPMAIEGTDILFDKNFMKWQNIANRDGGNMESWTWFQKNLRYFRLNEVKNPQASYYPDIDGRQDVEYDEAITDFLNKKNDLTGHHSEIQVQDNPNAGFQKTSYDTSSFDLNTEANKPSKVNIMIDETQEIPGRPKEVEHKTLLKKL